MDKLLENIRDDRLRRVYLYWMERRGIQRFPARSSIDPLDFSYLIGWVSLIDVTYDPLRFRFRLHGTNLRSKDQLDLTGRFLEEHPFATARELMAANWREVIDRRAPTHGFYDQTVDNQLVSFEALRLPLSMDGTSINMLLVATVLKH